MTGTFDEQLYGKRVGQKKGGIHKPDPDGGVYKRENGDGTSDTFLIKRDTEKPRNDVAEYLASAIFQATAPGYGAEIGLAKNTDPNPENKENHNAFLTSKYFSNYQDFFKAAGYKDRPTTTEALQSKLPDNLQYVKRELTSKDKNGEYKYQGYEKALVTSLLLGDFSVHSGNMGVVTGKDGKKNLVRIDFGAAFRNFSPDINPYESVKNRAGFEKNYFLRDHPKERIVSKEFAAELRNVAKVDLTPVIEKEWKNITDNFNERAMQGFGHQLGLDKNAAPDEIKEHFANRLKERQISMRNMATEIDIKLGMNGTEQDLQEAVKKAVEENPAFCKEILANPKKSQLNTKYPQMVLELLREELREEGLLPSQTPKTKPTGEKAVDSFVTGEPEKGPVKNIGNNSLGSVVDPITTMVRKEVLGKQADILHNTVGAIHPEVVRLSKEEFQAYLKAPENKEKIDKALAHPTIKQNFEKEIHETEVAGYKKLHEEFKDNLKPINWDSKAPKGEEKSQVIKNNEGQEICTLTEKTVKSSSTIALADGNTKEVASYRTIDFPKSLKEGAVGPMHVSLAVKDELGNNIAAEKAVYFTAHYDKAGKLTEVSSPQPVKFTGTGADAVGYIEREGKIYTLPVTQGKYKEMMQEVEVNKGTAVDLSQKMKGVEKTKDLVVTKPKDPIETAKDIGKDLHDHPPKPKPRSQSTPVPKKKSDITH